MHDHILFPTDGSDGATAIVDHALDLSESHGAMLHILNVADTTHDSVTRLGGEVVDVLEREGNEIVAEVSEWASERGVTTTKEVLQGGVPETIVEYAERYDIDVIVMPTRGRTGIARALLGSVTERVVRRASVPVLTVHPEEDVGSSYPYRRILVPTDGSACADAALDLGIELAKEYTASLHLLSVVDTASLGIDVSSAVRAEELDDEAEQLITEATETAEAAGVDSVVGATEHGASVSRAIRSYAKEHDIDVIVIGTHGRTGVDRYLIGSVAEKLVRTASVPVLTVPTPPSDE